MGKLRRHLRDNVYGLVAIFIALGGTAYAAVELNKNDVTSKHIKNGGVKGKDLANNAVTSPKVANGSLLSEDFARDQLPRGPQGDPGPAGSPDTPQQVLDKIAQVDGPGSGLDADTLDGLSASAFSPSDRIRQINFSAGPCMQASDAGCTAQFLGPDVNFALTAQCDDASGTPRLRVSLDEVPGGSANRSVNFNAVSGNSASQGGFGIGPGNVVLIEADQKAVVGTIVIRTQTEVVTIDYFAYAAAGFNSRFCQFVGNAVRT